MIRTAEGRFLAELFAERNPEAGYVPDPDNLRLPLPAPEPKEKEREEC